jgi:hypothetical protein
MVPVSLVEIPATAIERIQVLYFAAGSRLGVGRFKELALRLDPRLSSSFVFACLTVIVLVFRHVG